MINLFVSRLDYGVTQDDLMSLFKPYGFVKKVSIVTDRETGKSKGFAFIEMNCNDVQVVLNELDGYSLNNRAISVKIAEDKGSRPSSGNRPERKPFEANKGERKPLDNSRFNRPQRTENKEEYRNTEESNPKTENPIIFLPDDFASKSDRSKKSKSKKGFSGGTNDGPKKGRMQAYKKSGKSNRFFSDDDDFLY